jgi:uncharacterized SAM-binding protein YcdF (DUF218 family)
LTLALVAVRGVYPFLAPAAPLHEGVLVVEGWASDYVLNAAIAEFRSNRYDKIFVSGGPIEAGEPLEEYHTYAERGAAVLLKLGLTTNQVQAVSAPFVRQDRTYTCAVTLKRWWQAHDMAPRKLHLITAGPHARRSRLLYQKAFGPAVEIGVTPIADKNYDPARWWRYSSGVRGVVDESIAYVYARFLFYPHAE